MDKKIYAGIAVAVAVLGAGGWYAYNTVQEKKMREDLTLKIELQNALKQEEEAKEKAEVEVEAATAAAEKAEAEAEAARARRAAEKAEEQSAQMQGTFIPTKPNCRVSGNIPGYGNYTLVINDGWGQISPGVRNKQGKLRDVYYDRSTGNLYMDAYTMSDTYCGQYFGYLSVQNGRYVYEGYFCNTHGKQSSFVMTGK